MDEVTKGRLRGELSDKQYAERIESIKRFERQLTDNSYLVLKLFFQIGKKEQKKRLEELEASKGYRMACGRERLVAEQAL